MTPCLTLSNIRYISRVKWSNPGKEVAPSLNLGVVAIEKGAFMPTSTEGDNFTFTIVTWCKISVSKSFVLGIILWISSCV